MRQLDLLKSRNWPALVFIVAGFSMMTLWIIFTIVHGPTSFDRRGSVLGLSTFFWGSLLGGLPNLLLVLGLVGARRSLIATRSTVSKVGFILTFFGLFIPAAVDLITGSLGPPLFLPLVGIGLVLLGLANRRHSQVQKGQAHLFVGLGLLQLIAFAWILLPLEMSDQINGYRIYGLLSYILVGIGWVLLGRTMLMESAIDIAPHRSV